jgi:glucosamine-6-phosphate deaminase
LAWLHREEDLDFSACHTFNLDDYVGLPREHPNSYHYYMRQHLFRHVNINLEHTHLPDGMAVDLEAECARYEALIASTGGIDLQLLGMGQNGHLGFNEPLSAFYSRTRVQVLSPATHEQNGPLFASPAEMPKRAITMGLGSILATRRCLLLVTGEPKAEIVARALEGPVTSMVPATALQFHPHCTVILDEAAASRLEYIGQEHTLLQEQRVDL